MLLFLHGFLGQKEDFIPLLSHLPNTHLLRALDLPGHNGQKMEADIALAIQQQVDSSVDYVIGYSAGGRLALELKLRFPDQFKNVIALSTHPGLSTLEEKIARFQVDCEWVKLLEESPLEFFLEKWYSQPLFQELKKSPIFPSVLQRRKQQDPKQLALFLKTYSLAWQPSPSHFSQTVFVYGDKDLKYQNLYCTIGQLNSIAIPQAGHAVHLENPKFCAQIIKELIDEHH